MRRFGIAEDVQALELNRFESEFQLSAAPLPATKAYTSDLNSSCLDFLICKTED